MRATGTGSPAPFVSARPGVWPDENAALALAAFLQTADLITDPVWREVVDRATTIRDADAFFRDCLRPAPTIENVLFTGYHEPDLLASRVATERFRFPVCRLPDGLAGGTLWHDRAEIETKSLTRGLEIAWLDDPLEAFLLQVQGSGRLRFPDGETIRVGYAGTNGHPYRSIGAELVRLGEVPPDRMDIDAIRRWCLANPERRTWLLQHNPSFVFFRVLDLSPESGPLGSMGRPVTARRSIAVDPSRVPLGAPVWVEVDGPQRFARLMIAQDTGSAIKGPQRADIFFGCGVEAARLAGELKSSGRMTVLLPRRSTGS